MHFKWSLCSAAVLKRFNTDKALFSCNNIFMSVWHDCYDDQTKKTNRKNMVNNGCTVYSRIIIVL